MTLRFCIQLTEMILCSFYKKREAYHGTSCYGRLFFKLLWMKFKHFSKFEIAGIGSLKGVHVAAYGLSLMSLHQMLSKYWGFIFIFKKKPAKSL